MADRYPIAQFPDLNLPGFQSEATLAEAAQLGTDWQRGLSLSIFSINPENPGQLDVLTGIRTDGTETHPNVVSTPTGRFPKHFEAPLVDSRAKFLIDEPLDPLAGLSRDAYPTPHRFRLDRVDTRENQIAASYRPNLVIIPDREDPLAYLAHEILARKLGLGEALQKRDGSAPLGTISLQEVIAGFSYAADDPETGKDLWEPLILYGATVLLHDRALIPAKTTAYRALGWTPLKDFIIGQTHKHAELLVPSITPEDEAAVCVRGLCLTTTGTLILSSDLRAHLGLETHDLRS